MMFELGLGLIAAGLVISILGSLFYIINAFKVHAGWGLAILFLPFASIAFFFAHFKKAIKPTFASFVGMVMMPVGVFLAPSDPAFDTKLVGYIPQAEELGIQAEMIPSFSEAIEMVKQIDVDELTAARREGRAPEWSGAPGADGDDAPSEETISIELPEMFKFGGKKESQPEVVAAPPPSAPAAAGAEAATPEPTVFDISNANVRQSLIGLSEEAVSDELGKPLGVGSKRGLTYWMYVDRIVTFDQNRRVAKIDFDGGS